MAQQHPTIPASALDFLKQLQQNNNRDWFNAHKDTFVVAQDSIGAFAEAVLAELNMTDVIETPSGKKSQQRIYRDTRFSGDKTPYKRYWGGGFTRATPQRRGGYYYHIEGGGNTFVAGAFWSPSAADLKLIRKDIDYDAQPLRDIINSQVFKDNFGTLQGEQLKSMPKGYPATHPAIDLLRYKQFLVIKRFTDEEVLSPNFVALASQAYRDMRPFLDYMSEVLYNGCDLG